MLREWYLSGLGALAEFIREDIDKLSEKELAQKFQDNFSKIVNSWIMEEEVEEFDPENEIVVPRMVYDGYSAIASKLFSGILANKWHMRELKKPDEIGVELENVSENVLEDGEEIYVKRGTAGEYIGRRMAEWGERNGKCAVCEEEGKVDHIKQYIFPFTIVNEKFPNLRAGMEENINVCRKCAIVLFSAYSNMIFNLNGDFLNTLTMYSEDIGLLRHFKDRVLRESFDVKYNTNLKGIEQYRGVRRPFDLLFVALNEFSKKPEFKEENSEISYGDINFIVAGTNVRGRKKIYLDSDYIEASAKLWELFLKWREKYEGCVRIFFHGMVPDLDNEDLVINRNRFLKRMLINKEVDYQALEKAMFANISERGDTLPFFKTIVSTFLGVYEKMDEKEIFEQVSKKGYAFGKQVIEREGANLNRAKGHLYQLRRTRDLANFLDSINSIQTSLGLNFNQKVFLANKEKFDKLKPIFLISMANAVFGGDENE